ncbi:hypothetical protein FNQ90_23050, partial [Streptomyces alkaliphilus]
MTTIQPAENPPTGAGSPGLPLPTVRAAEVPGWRAGASSSGGRSASEGITRDPARLAPPPPAHHPLGAARPVRRTAALLLFAAVLAGLALLIAGPPAP